MGLGRLGDRNLVLKRKFRWTFRVDNVCDGQFIPESFVKVASRPNITFEETEINYLNAKDWIPGKASWETITVSYYDVASLDNQVLWNWLASVYEFPNPVTLRMGSNRRSYAGRGTLTMFGGSGEPLEQFVLDNLWPQSVNFGDLDMADSSECNVELTMRYSNVAYRSLCPAYQPQGCYFPCQ